MEEQKKFPIELEKIRTESKTREMENAGFRLFIKKFKSTEADEILHRISRNVSSNIDCTQCGNCCRSLHPAVREDEIKRLAVAKEMTEKLFANKFLQLSASREYYILDKPPCTFLNGNLCSIYANRPDSCGAFPHLDVTDLKFRMRRILDNYGICPIVYHTIEFAKQEMGFEK